MVADPVPCGRYAKPAIEVFAGSKRLVEAKALSTSVRAVTETKTWQRREMMAVEVASPSDRQTSMYSWPS